MGLPLTACGPTDELEKLSDLSRDLAQQYLRSASETLGQLLRTPNLLSGVRLERAPRRYTRNFLFGDCSMSAWVMVWAPGSTTSIHDHHCSCCFAVLRGSLREIWFKPDGEECAVKTADALRASGYIACMLPSGPNIHQMTNDGPEEAISIHIYGFDHRRHASSVAREYRLASR
jgi:predicted metal-dependent enzyme (double-stranded beta helix superfamily)